MALLAQTRGVKRPLDLETLNEALPSTCAGAALLSDASQVPQKRTKVAEMAAQPPAGSTGSPSAATPLHERVNRSAFPPMQLPEAQKIEEIVMSALGSPKRQEERQRSPFRGEEGGHAAGAQAQGAGAEKLYTQGEVEHMLKRNVAPKILAMLNQFLDDREQVVRQRYNGILTERLNEQFQSFSKFNQDWVSRQLKDHPFSYVS
mmetsp:Transcript_12448/g.19605  ORF Transcript_12448/g.19605 Transcript_12448/m.19605 type:complete len:204 (+) Transcript_12448:173-784(+)|eukprot:CAMPEP_0184300302 /NCGR_PEP_ID=MMETSP1049-20130417/10736_1 /TAXON_ID=77928 /ORGANISM="Proteomonas sulcata, Strain CCMP704" /LENGTH=203 /DNA_ID=CAMNT_0026610979 /DNA_START=167 /DNA_END=778 /DNA_ORIENTATION=+